MSNVNDELRLVEAGRDLLIAQQRARCEIGERVEVIHQLKTRHVQFWPRSIRQARWLRVESLIVRRGITTESADCQVLPIGNDPQSIGA